MMRDIGGYEVKDNERMGVDDDNDDDDDDHESEDLEESEEI